VLDPGEENENEVDVVNTMVLGLGGDGTTIVLDEQVALDPL
jgi:hypothetical protein